MINTKIINIDAKSLSITTTLISLASTIVMILILGISALFVFPQIISILKLFSIPESILMMFIPIILVGLICSAILNLIVGFIDAKIYNYLLKYTTGIQIELTPHNEIKEIDLVHSSLAVTLVNSVWLIAFTIIVSLLYLLIAPSLVSALNLNITFIESALTSSIPIVLFIAFIIAIIIVMFISIIITLFILNFWLSKNPIKVEIVEDEQIEIKKVDVSSLILSAGLTNVTLAFLFSLTNIFTSEYAEMAILNLIVNILIVLISVTVQGLVYNIVAEKITGLKLNIIPSDNITPEYVQNENNPTEINHY